MLYPILTDSRALMDLSGDWDFKADNGHGFEEKWFERPLEGGMLMPVPASYNDIKEDAALRDHYGWVFYQRTVMVPRYLSGQRIVLRMDAVTHKARVYWNGRLICEHKGGFLPFEVELTDNFAAGGNLLTIAVDNRIDYTTLPLGRQGKSGAKNGFFAGIEPTPSNHPGFDFFNYCGITRPVELYTTPKTYIRDLTLVPDFEGSKGYIDYTVDIAGDKADLAETVVEVYDKNGALKASGNGISGRLTIEDVQLWMPLKPYLYDVKVTCGEDVYMLPFGIRTVKVEGKKFLINGQPFYFKGYGKHEDTFPSGRGLNRPMNAKDISLMKWQGANSFRTSHYPYSEEMMRLCDAEGIVVIDETPAVGLNLKFGGGIVFSADVTSDTYGEGGIATFDHHMDVIRDLIDRDKNHACVVMWSIGNEPDSDGDGAYEYFKPLFDLAREHDPQSRPCTLVVMQMADPTKDVSLRLADVYCLNRYYGWYEHGDDLEMARKIGERELEFWNSQDKPFMFTEYGADTVMGLHDTLPMMFTEEFQVEYYKMNNTIVDAMDGFIGEQVWNFADFATCQGTGRVQGNKKGIFTRDRKPKLAAHYLRERWHQIPDFGYKA